MLVEEKEEIKPAYAKLAMGNKTSNVVLLYINGFAINMTLFPKISHFLWLFSSEIPQDSVKASNIIYEVPLFIL